MLKREWLINKKEACEQNIEYYHDRINELQKELEVIKGMIDLLEGQSAADVTAR